MVIRLSLLDHDGVILHDTSFERGQKHLGRWTLHKLYNRRKRFETPLKMPHGGEVAPID